MAFSSKGTIQSLGETSMINGKVYLCSSYCENYNGRCNYYSGPYRYNFDSCRYHGTQGDWGYVPNNFPGRNENKRFPIIYHSTVNVNNDFNFISGGRHGWSTSSLNETPQRYSDISVSRKPKDKVITVNRINGIINHFNILAHRFGISDKINTLNANNPIHANIFTTLNKYIDRIKTAMNNKCNPTLANFLTQVKSTHLSTTPNIGDIIKTTDFLKYEKVLDDTFRHSYAACKCHSFCACHWVCHIHSMRSCNCHFYNHIPGCVCNGFEHSWCSQYCERHGNSNLNSNVMAPINL